MAFDERLAVRVRAALQDVRGIEEKKMFGGLCFLLRGHMCCGIVGGELMVRVGPEAYPACLREPHARAMDFTGRPMKGLVTVAAAGLTPDAALAAWVARGRAYAACLPPKK